MAEFRQGDRVAWSSHGGTATGEVVRKITSDTEAAGRTVRASKDEPQYLVRSVNGGEAVHNSDSVTSLKAVEGMVEQARDTFGGLHAVINPAGILRDGMFHKMSEDDWDRVIDVHLRGSFNVCRATIEHFRDQQDGAYMLFTSTSGITEAG